MDIDALKQAAIDAYMRSEGFTVHTDREGDRYTDIGLVIIEKVDKNGSGRREENGGGMGPNPRYDVDYTSHFSDVRTRVDNALKPWKEDRLPEPDSLNRGRVEAEAAVTALNVGNANSFGGALGGYLKTISDNAPSFRGAAMNAFNNSFINQLPAVISNHGCLAAVVAEAWAAEKEIWAQARADRDTHVEKATSALKSYAETETPSEIKFALALAGAAVAGASAVATGGVALPFALATAGITALSASAAHAEELKVERTGANYEDLMAAFEDGLGDIDKGIEKEETLVKESLEDAWTVFENNRPLFDLTPRVSDDGDGKWGDETSLFDVKDASDLEIVLPSQAVIDALTSGMTNLGHGLEDAEPKITAGADDGNLLASTARDVGLVYNNASIWMWIVGDNNSSSIRDLTWDVKKGNQMLGLVIKDFRDADANSQSDLDRMRKRLSGGSGEDPWE